MYRVIGGDKQEYGPATTEEVRGWIGEGRLSRESMTREERSETWRPLSEFPEFSDALEEQRRRFRLSPQSEPPPLRLPHAEIGRSINVSDCLARGWQLWMSNFVFFLAATFMVWTLMMALQFLPLMAVMYWLLRGVLYGGLCVVVLKRLRDEPVHLNEVFSGFGSSFMQLMLVGMITSLLTWLGMFFCLIPGIYFGILWIFSVPSVADRKVEFWSGMELSRKAVGAQWPKVFVLTLIAFLPVILISSYTELKVGLAMYEGLKTVVPETGPVDLKLVFEQMNKVSAELAGKVMPLILTSKIVLLLNLPFGLSALLCAYEDVLGASSKRRD